MYYTLCSCALTPKSSIHSLFPTHSFTHLFFIQLQHIFFAIVSLLLSLSFSIIVTILPFSLPSARLLLQSVPHTASFYLLGHSLDRCPSLQPFPGSTLCSVQWLLQAVSHSTIIVQKTLKVYYNWYSKHINQRLTYYSINLYINHLSRFFDNYIIVIKDKILKQSFDQILSTLRMITSICITIIWIFFSID